MEEKVRQIAEELEKLLSELDSAEQQEKLSELVHDLYVVSELLRCGFCFRVDESGIHPDFQVLSTDQIYVEWLNDNLTLKEIKEELQQKTMQQLPRLLSEAVSVLRKTLKNALQGR